MIAAGLFGILAWLCNAFAVVSFVINVIYTLIVSLKAEEFVFEASQTNWLIASAFALGCGIVFIVLAMIFGGISAARDFRR